jgi:hypothetical protein
MFKTTVAAAAFAAVVALTGSAQAQVYAAPQPYTGMPGVDAPIHRYDQPGNPAWEAQRQNPSPYCCDPSGHQQPIDRLRPGITGIWPGDPRW